MDFNLALAVLWYSVFIVSLTFHEAAHAFAVLKLGDPTAYYLFCRKRDVVPMYRDSWAGINGNLSLENV